MRIKHIGFKAALATGLALTTAAAADPVTDVARPFDPGDVRLLPGRFEENAERAQAYLLGLDPDRLLSGFRSEAGLKPKAAKYGGWESAGVAGCSLGHYLSACAFAARSSGDTRLNDRVAYVVDQLDECQRANGDGYVSAIPGGKRVFAEVARGDIRSKGFDLNGGWVPWYTMHKVMAGVRDAYVVGGNAKARDVLVQLADWADREVANLTDEQVQRMLLCEQGGMTEVLADVAGITGDGRYLKLAGRFNHHAVIDPLTAGQDRLAGLHANTQIPKVIGAAREYELGGDDALRRVAVHFWDAVVNHHTYATGGNSDGEHFGPPDVLSPYLSDHTTETCNTYNMLKLSRHLFSWTGDPKYADFYERAVVNHILGSQNPKTAQVTYYVPLRSGARRQWQGLTNAFTCCVGSGMENHVRYGDAIYFHDDRTLWVNLFVASTLDWRDAGVRVRMESPFPRPGPVTIAVDPARPTRFTLKVRRPAWATDFAVAVNGRAVDPAGSTPSSYVDLDREWRAGDRVTVDAPYHLRAEPQPDKPDQVAIFDGPVLLAAKVAEADDRPAVLVDASPDLLRSIRPAGDAPLAFRTAGIGRPADLDLAPFYDAWADRYAVYLDRFTPAQWHQAEADYQARHAAEADLRRRTVDVLAIAQMQPERDHDLTGEHTRVGDGQGRKWRDATGDGWFEFTMKVDPACDNDLVCTYWGGESPRRTFDVRVDGKPLARQALDNDHPGQFFDVAYRLPRATATAATVRVRFASVDRSMVGGCFGARVVRVAGGR